MQHSYGPRHALCCGTSAIQTTREMALPRFSKLSLATTRCLIASNDNDATKEKNTPGRVRGLTANLFHRPYKGVMPSLVATCAFNQAPRNRRMWRYQHLFLCSVKPAANNPLQLPIHSLVGGCQLLCAHRGVSSLASLSGTFVTGWAVSAVVVACGFLSYLFWWRQQQLFVQSGACAAAVECSVSRAERSKIRNNFLIRSSVRETSKGAIEYVYLPNPRSAAAGDLGAPHANGGGDMLLFFHGGLCGSDQLLASGLCFPPNIEHLLLPNRRGYLRSDPPPSWDKPQDLRVLRQRRRHSEVLEYTSKTACERFLLYRHRLREQAALFNDLVSSVVPSDPSKGVGVHLLGVGEGCAHAIAYAHFYPQRVKTVSVLAPVLQLQKHTAKGPLESQILKRIQVYRRVLQLLPQSAQRLSLPPPRLSPLEWLASGASRLAPTTSLMILLHFICFQTPTACLSVSQVLTELQQQQPLQQLLQQASYPGEGNSNSAATSWGVQQQNAWEAQQQLSRQLLRRVQHLTGTCCVAQRLAGFLEDALLLTPLDGADEGAEVHRWLLQCFAELQVPGLVVYAGGTHGKLDIKQYLSEPRRASLEFVELPETQPQTVLLTHATRLNSAIKTLYMRCASENPLWGPRLVGDDGKV